MTLGERIRELRRKRGLTQGELATLAGYRASSMISQIETGQLEPSLKGLEAIATALAVRSSTLIDEDLFAAQEGQALVEVGHPIDETRGSIVRLAGRIDSASEVHYPPGTARDLGWLVGAPTTWFALEAEASGGALREGDVVIFDEGLGNQATSGDIVLVRKDGLTERVGELRAYPDETFLLPLDPSATEAVRLSAVQATVAAVAVWIWRPLRRVA